MPLAIQQKKLLLTEEISTITYDFGIVQRIESLGEEPIKNQITATIKKTFVKKDSLGYLYKIEVTDRKQSNIDDMLGLEMELAFLQKNILLYTNSFGEIISIVNRGQIAEDWYDQAKLIKKGYSLSLIHI